MRRRSFLGILSAATVGTSQTDTASSSPTGPALRAHSACEPAGGPSRPWQK